MTYTVIRGGSQTSRPEWDRRYLNGRSLSPAALTPANSGPPGLITTNRGRFWPPPAIAPPLAPLRITACNQNLHLASIPENPW